MVFDLILNIKIKFPIPILFNFKASLYAFISYGCFLAPNFLA